MLGRKLIIVAFQGDSVLDSEALEGTVISESKSKTWPDSLAYVVQLDPESQQKLTPHTIAPKEIFVDLDGTPVDRLPGMPGYVGGAFVRFYGRNDEGDTRFGQYLGRGEAIERRGQQPLYTPPAAYQNDAARVIQLAKTDFGADLEISLRGLREAGKVVARVGWGGVSDPTRKGRLIFMWGAFFGECLIANYHGRWTTDAVGRECVELPRSHLDPLRVNPFHLPELLANHQNENGIEDWLARVEAGLRSSARSVPSID
jgi:hypothetical protein